MLLMLAYMVSFMDRVLISLLIEPIRTEFGLSGTEIGLLVGFGFVLFYSLLGVPFGALADRTNRRDLILFGLVGWSLATSLSAFTGGFASLFAARAAVGVGEAALSPAAISTIADRFDRARIGFATSLYTSGVVIGGGGAMAFGGALVFWASHNTLDVPLVGPMGGWRLAMLIVGAIGLPLALLMRLTMREAPRSEKAAAPPFSALFDHMRQHPKAFGAVFTGYSFVATASYIPLLWCPVLFIRAHGMSVQEIGNALGIIVGLGGFAGIMAGGLLSDRWTKRGMVDAPVRVVFWSTVLQLPFLAGAYLVADKTTALILLGVGEFFCTMFGGVQATTLQLLTPGRMRGRMMAIYLLVVTLVGMGAGSVAIGALSDLFEGPQGLGVALATVSSVSLLICAVCLIVWRGAIRGAIAAEEAREAAVGA